MRSAYSLLLGTVLLAGLAAADEVVLSDGRVVEGKVIARTDDAVVVKTVVGLHEVTTTLDAKDVATVKKSRSRADGLLAEYRRLRSRIDPQRPEDLYRLGKWMLEHKGFEAGAKKLFERALELDPNHEATRKHLGYSKGPEGRWLAPGERPAPGADGGADMLVEIMSALGLSADEGSPYKEIPYGMHPFEELNYRFYREGPARNEYLGLRYRQYGLPGARTTGPLDLVTKQMFDHTDFYDEVIDSLTGEKTLVPRTFPGGTPVTSLPQVGGVLIQDVPAYNAAAARFGFPTIPQVGVTPRIPLKE